MWLLATHFNYAIRLTEPNPGHFQTCLKNMEVWRRYTWGQLSVSTTQQKSTLLQELEKRQDRERQIRNLLRGQAKKGKQLRQLTRSSRVLAPALMWTAATTTQSYTKLDHRPPLASKRYMLHVRPPPTKARTGFGAPPQQTRQI